MMYNHILLSTDLTSQNQDVAKKAKRLSELLGAKLSLLHVVEPIPNYGYIGIADLEEQLVNEAKKQLSTLGNTLAVAPADQWIAVGPAKREILSTANTLGIDLIIIGSHDGTQLSDLLGSTTNGVLHHSPCDVLTIRHGE